MTNRLTSKRTYVRLTLAAAATMAVCLASPPAALGQEVRMQTIVPSPYWQHHPYYVRGDQPTISRAPRKDLRRLCAMEDLISASTTVDACTLFVNVGGDWPTTADKRPHCSIFVAREEGTGEHYRLLIEHEDAHCRGWTTDHPDGPVQ